MLRAFHFKELNKLSRRKTGGPRPLKIVSAQPAGHIDDFADEIQTGHAPRLHCFRREFIRIDAAKRDFRFRVTFRAVATNFPPMTC